MITILKLGGSLMRSPLLPGWLGLAAGPGKGRIVIVPGGGLFADAGRAAQAHWRLNDVSAHNIAVLGMAQLGEVMRGLCPNLATAGDEATIRACLSEGRSVIWQPLDLLRAAPDELTTWDVTSDSLALWLARRLGAQETIIVKSCALPQPANNWAALSQRGIVDRAFAGFAVTAGAIRIVERSAIERVRASLEQTGQIPDMAAPGDSAPRDG